MSEETWKKIAVRLKEAGWGFGEVTDILADIRPIVEAEIQALQTRLKAKHEIEVRHLQNVARCFREALNRQGLEGAKQ